MSRRRQSNRSKENNKIIAGLLAFIGGTFGIHRFYLNDVGGGIFYIFLFFITIKFFPVTMILGIIEALRLFNMDQEAFDEKYNKGVASKSRRFQREHNPRYKRDRNRAPEPSMRDRNERKRKTRERYKRTRKSIPKRNPFKTSAMQKYKDFDLQDAIVDFEKALKIAERDPEIHFYLAAVYSLSEKKDKAFKHLELAVEYGLKDVEKINTYEDLAFVRIQDEFESFKDNGYKVPSFSPSEAKPEAAQAEVLDDDILLSQLNKLDELRKRGLISNEEFMIEKEKLIEHRK